jgi:LL-diaminopimelate aminotransferase
MNDSRSTLRISSRIAQTAPYAFAEVDKQVALLRAKGVHVIDFGVGDPRDPTPPFIIDALARSAATHAASGYPNYEGSPAYRQACAEYMQREFGVRLDSDTEVLSTIGAKEAVFHFPLGVIEPGDVVLCPSPGYPPYKTGTRFGGGVPYFLPLRAENDFLIDFESVPRDILSKARILWTNYPNSPTGRAAPRVWLESLYAWARRHDIIIAADEGCYIDLYFNDRPASMLNVGREGVITFYSLSKRSNMTGYRVGFCTGDSQLIGSLQKVKTNIDSGVPWFIQDAAIAALCDTIHVEKLRRSYAEKRSLMLAALAKTGLPPCTSDATFYLWQKAPAEMTGLELARRLLELGIVVTPGQWISDQTTDGSNPGADYVRLALVASKDDVLEAQRRLATVRIG